MINIKLTESQLALQTMAKEFAEKEVKPIVAELDKVSNPGAEEAFPWKIVKKGSELGLRTIPMPKEYGGTMEVDKISELLILDQIGYADFGCAKMFSQTWKIIELIALAGTKDQKDRYLPLINKDDTFLTSMAITEPDSGSDMMLPYTGPEGGVKLSAEPKGKGFVLNGMKHFISLAPQSKLALVAGRTNKAVGGAMGLSFFLVPKNTKGLSVGRIHDKLGWRSYSGGELIFDNVFVPNEDILGGEVGVMKIAMAMYASGAFGQLEVSVLLLAGARAAYDLAMSYAKERKQGGKRIIEHQAIGLRLAEMFVQLQAADSLVWTTAAAVNSGSYDPKQYVSARVIAGRVAVDVCMEAVQIFGGVGMDKDAPVEKLLRDSLMSFHAGGTVDVLKLNICNMVSGETLFGKPVIK